MLHQQNSFWPLNLSCDSIRDLLSRVMLDCDRCISPMFSTPLALALSRSHMQLKPSFSRYESGCRSPLYDLDFQVHSNLHPAIFDKNLQATRGVLILRRMVSYYMD